MGLCRVRGSAQKVLPASRPPGPGRAHLPTRGQRPADAQLGRCWTSVVSGQRTEVAHIPGGGGGVLVRRSSSRGEKPAQLESVERPGAGGGIYSHGTRTRPHRPFPVPTPGKLSTLCLCVRPPGGLPPPTACPVSGGSQTRCSLSHLLERWSWGFLIADFVSSSPHHGGCQCCLRPFRQAGVSITVVISLHCGGVSLS